jgi:hypothetical protein
MGKVIWKKAGPDDPMFKEGYRSYSPHWAMPFTATKSPPPPKSTKPRKHRKPSRKGRVTVLFVAAMGAGAIAASQPQPKPAGPGGSCPFGYYSSGSFCAPSEGAQDAIPKPPNGTCPLGWTSSGSFCLKSGS